MSCLHGLAVCAGALAAVTPFAGSSQTLRDALPIVGTGGHGHTYPGVTAPFGFVQLSPDTRTEGWDACSGYHYSDHTILGFSHTHLSGTGCADLADVLILPFTGSLNSDQSLTADRFKSSFSHTNELAEPGYYRVLLDRWNVLAELTATAHTGIHRYTFRDLDERHVLIDLAHGIGNEPIEARLEIQNSNSVAGYRRSRGWAKDKTIYFVIESSEPFSAGLELDAKQLPPDQRDAKGKSIRAHLDFAPSAEHRIVLRVGLSPTSVDDARKNLELENPSWDFDGIRRAAQMNWETNLSRIQIECSNPNIRQTFYSALYHTMLAPTLYNNADRSYRGADGRVHAVSGFQNYCTFSLWDTFRAEHPLLTLTAPERVNDFVRSILAFYQESPDHALPVWPLASCETWCMIANHSIPVIADAYAKGFRDFDAELALKAMRDTATNSRRHQADYERLGYIPSANGKRNEATSTTLELAYDDWCIAQFAEAIGKKSDAESFAKRARSYRNVFDPKTGFFRGRTADGKFREPFDPKQINFDDFTEANAWQYTFAIFHDTPELIELYGGKEKFIAKLDELFDQDSDMPNALSDVTGLIGQYAHGNEPCHHVAYLYALAGAQHKTARRVRDIMLTQYDNTPEGLCGNEDCGQMSAWYVWSAIGLYPLNPANGVYVIGSPIVTKAVVQLDPKFYPSAKDGAFTIIAKNASKQNCYVHSAKLNGKPLGHPWITHAEVAAGGVLELEMAAVPDKQWNGSSANEHRN